MEAVGQRHIAMMMMMAEGFAIGGHVNEMRLLAVVGEGPHQPHGEVLAAVEQSAVSDAV